MEALEPLERAQLLPASRGGRAAGLTETVPYREDCEPYTIPSGGVLVLSPEATITLTADALFTPKCTPGVEQSHVYVGRDVEGEVPIVDTRDPFHASITPQAYATGAATVIAWMLVIMLIITPRTFFVGGASGRSGLMGRRGMISGATGGGSVIGVGTRPWLQKVAALTVAVSLTLATADTFKIAQEQYEEGVMDAVKLRNMVVSSTEIKVSRVISDVFLWLAQVQTLIRLFPRHKEKVIIKWVGFALVLLDITFSCLNSFGPWNQTGRPRKFETAIPALSYLFQLSLSMLYAAWVMYYAITKRQYAFYHSMMWNIAIVALLSIVAILTPVVFFITDIADYTIAGWGDYFRWVGAAAASVIVWEWVERIEALEREERKDGILGREIYDGDDMLETTPCHEIWPHSHHGNTADDKKKRGDGRRGGGFSGFATGAGHGFGNMARRLGRAKRLRISPEMPHTERRKRVIHIPVPAPARRKADAEQLSPRASRNESSARNGPQVPVIHSPVSRTETTSADSTVYEIRYHPVSDSPAAGGNPTTTEITYGKMANEVACDDPEKGLETIADTTTPQNRSRWVWPVSNPFRRQGRTPPQEVQRGRVIEPLAIDDVSVHVPPRHYTGLALKARLGTFAAQQGEKIRSLRGAGQQTDSDLPVTIIPAQPRGRTWSPQQDNNIITGEAGSDLQLQGSGTTDVTEGANLATATTTSPTLSSRGGTAGALQAGPAAMGHRTPQVRFAPEVHERYAADQPAGLDTSRTSPTQPGPSSTLGVEIFEEPQRNESSPDNSPAATGVDGRPTNHDR
ncbi:PalH-domain-containing protein [Westerdykella ornata]|uniref:PalH-domain-containing protein n=1 Tax=Westerdykella ornata TaxID=318751 RepID=A0A6A6JJH1_WESOR|nr:PalH-domain-containing protein [Westerdykella ornata]KAF2276414.1 PalH-domain-containing protein [Westerdykella ornata]